MENPAGTVGNPLADPGSGSTGPAARPPLRFYFASGAQPLPGYTIKRGIGAGGFGEVYYATSDAGKEVALKYIQRNLEIELRGVRQCLNIKHPNLLALFDIRHDENGLAWVVMEYVAGESLKDVIDRYPQGMPPEEIRHWLTGMVAGVQYLHDHGIVHRDIKPGNLFLDQGMVKIGDYGLSKFISCSRRSGHTESVGTFHYMAPEIGQGRYGKEIDIYALGVVLHEMVTGRVPFDGESSQEIIMKHLTAQPNLREVVAPYRYVIGRALAKRPEQRYPDAHRMLVDLGWAPPAAGETSSRWSAESGAAAAQGAASSPETSVPAERGSQQGPHGVAPGLADTTVGEKYPVPDPQGPIPIEVLGDAVAAGENYWPPVLVPSDPSSWPTPASGPLIPRVDTLRSTPVHAHRRSVPGAMFPEPVKWALLVATVLLIITRAKWLMPLALTLGTVYGFYLLFSVLLDLTFGTAEGDGPDEQRFVPTATQLSPRGGRRERLEQVRRALEPLRGELRNKSWTTRIMELQGSLLISSVVALVLSFVMTVLSGEDQGGRWIDWMPDLAWLAFPSILGSWVLLAIAKFWEGDESDPTMRRFAQALLGMGLGAATGWFGRYINVDPTYIINVTPITKGHLPQLLYPTGGGPTPYAYALYFGALFLIIRWWRRCDPLRPHRLGVWATLTPPVAAVLLCLLFPIPRGFLIATTITIAVQLAAPWVADERRSA